MKETKEAAKMLRAKAAEYVKLAGLLEKLDDLAADYRPAQKRRLTAQGRKNIAAAQKKRWAKTRMKLVHGGKKKAA